MPPTPNPQGRFSRLGLSAGPLIPGAEMSVVGRARRAYLLLHLAGSDGLSADVRFGKLARHAVMVIETSAQTWRVQSPRYVDYRVVQDDEGVTVARIEPRRKDGAIVLESGERFPFGPREHAIGGRQWLLGDNLFLAKPNWFWPAFIKEFTADISPELARRADRMLLITLASALTHEQLVT